MDLSHKELETMKPKKLIDMNMMIGDVKKIVDFALFFPFLPFTAIDAALPIIPGCKK